MYFLVFLTISSVNVVRTDKPVMYRMRKVCGCTLCSIIGLTVIHIAFVIPMTVASVGLLIAVGSDMMSLASVKEALRRLRWRRERMERSASIHSKRQSKKNLGHSKYARKLPYGHKAVLQHVSSLVVDFVKSDGGVCVLDISDGERKTPEPLHASRCRKTEPVIVLNAMQQQQCRAEVSVHSTLLFNTLASINKID